MLQSAAAEPESTAVRRPTRAGEQPCPHRTLLLLPFVLHGLHSVRGWAYPQPRLDVCWIGYVSSTYRNFVLFIFLPILHGYVSTAYPMRIRIGYVSDTGYAPSLAYRGNVALDQGSCKTHAFQPENSQDQKNMYPRMKCLCTQLYTAAVVFSAA